MRYLTMSSRGGTLVVMEKGKRPQVNLLHWLIQHESTYKLAWLSDWLPGDARLDSMAQGRKLLFITAWDSDMDFLYLISSYRTHRPDGEVALFVDAGCQYARTALMGKFAPEHVWTSTNFTQMQSWLRIPLPSRQTT